MRRLNSENLQFLVVQKSIGCSPRTPFLLVVSFHSPHTWQRKFVSWGIWDETPGYSCHHRDSDCERPLECSPEDTRYLTILKSGTHPVPQRLSQDTRFGHYQVSSGYCYFFHSDETNRIQKILSQSFVPRKVGVSDLAKNSSFRKLGSGQFLRLIWRTSLRCNIVDGSLMVCVVIDVASSFIYLFLFGAWRRGNIPTRRNSLSLLNDITC